MSGWQRHPGVRSGGELTRGEIAADKMRNGMGSWGFVFSALGFLGLWVVVAESRVVRIDNPQLTILNLVLSCVAALQGAILLIAAKRSDQISSELARHDYEADIASRELLTVLQADFASLTVRHGELTAQHGEQTRLLAQVLDAVGAGAAGAAVREGGS